MFVSFLKNVSHYCFMRWGQKFRKCNVFLRWDHQTNSQYNAHRNTSPGLFTFYFNNCLRVPVNEINRFAYVEWPPKSAGNDTNRFYLHKVVIQNRLFQHGLYNNYTKPYTFMFCETAMNQLVYIYLYDWTPL